MLKVILDVLNRYFVIVGLGQRNVTEVVDPAGIPGDQLKFLVSAPQATGDMPNAARSEVLVPLGRTVSGRVRNPDEADIASPGISVPGTLEKCRHIVPVPVPHLGTPGLDFIPGCSHVLSPELVILFNGDYSNSGARPSDTPENLEALRLLNSKPMCSYSRQDAIFMVPFAV